MRDIENSINELCEASGDKTYANLRGVGDSYEVACEDFSGCFEKTVDKINEKVKQAKREAINELLALHKQDRAKVNSQCDTLINMSTVDKYLMGLERVL